MFDMSPKVVNELVKEGADGAASLADCCNEARKTTRDLADGTGGSG